MNIIYFIVFVYCAFIILITQHKFQRLLIYLNWVRNPPSFITSCQNLQYFALHNARNIKLISRDGCKIFGWHVVPGGKDSIKTANLKSLAPENKQNDDRVFDEILSKPNTRVVLYLHGNAGSRGTTARVNIIKSISAYFLSHVVIIDYRGYADSEGSPTEEGVVEDARAALEWISERLIGKDSHIYVYGHSLGTGISVQLLANHPELASKVSGLILDCPFTSIADAAMYYPLALPIRLIPGHKYMIQKLLKLEFRSKEAIEHVNCPIIIIHAEFDSRIPNLLGKALYDAVVSFRSKACNVNSDNTRKTTQSLENETNAFFYVIPNTGHNNCYSNPIWITHLDNFFAFCEK